MSCTDLAMSWELISINRPHFLPKPAVIPPTIPSATIFLTAFFGPIFSPEKSVFLFDPILLFLAIAVGMNWRRVKSLPMLVVVTGFVSFILLAAAFGRTYWWDGNSAWGPRHHLVPIEVMCTVAFALAVNWFGELRPWLKALVADENIVVAITCPKLWHCRKPMTSS